MNGGIRNHPLSDGPSSYIAEYEESPLTPESSDSEDSSSDSETSSTDDDSLGSVSIVDSDEENLILLEIRFTPLEMQRIRFDKSQVLRAIQTVLDESTPEGPTEPWQTEQIVMILAAVAATCVVVYLLVAGPEGVSLVIKAAGAYLIWDLASAGIYGMSRLHRYRAVARICVVQSGRILIMAVSWAYEGLHLAWEREYCGVWHRAVSVVAPLPGILAGVATAALNGMSQLGQWVGKSFAGVYAMRPMCFGPRAQT